MHEQKIYFGAPGTGKSYLIDKKLRDEGILEHKIFRVVIHPEYNYCDFVGQLLPERGEDGSVCFNFKEGPFTKALVEAYSDFSENVYLVIEELSRGNVAAIFGDIFQLLDRDEHFESRYSINNKNIADRIVTLVSDNVKLPSNFNILCTVNMNDQNVYPMDTAFKRRFEWEYVSTEAVKGEDGNFVNNPRIYINGDDNIIETDWVNFYTKLNSFITDKIDGLGKNEDKQVGQFFLDFNKKLIEASYTDNENAKTDINNLIKNKLLLYLWQDVQSFAGERSLFDRSITSYDVLYNSYGKRKVFSNNFLSKFN